MQLVQCFITYIMNDTLKAKTMIMKETTSNFYKVPNPLGAKNSTNIRQPLLRKL